MRDNHRGGTQIFIVPTPEMPRPKWMTCVSWGRRFSGELHWMPPWRDIAEFWPEPSVGPIKSNKYKWPNLRLEGAEYDCRAKGQMPSQNTLILHRSSIVWGQEAKL